MEVEGRKFVFVSTVKPKLEPDGSIWTHEPQARYAKAASSKHHAYGNGAFCKFILPGATDDKGVYLMVSENQIMYVGETVELKRRFNAGYGNISPRNCFVGGQPTNCRINKLILNLLLDDQQVEIWFCACEDHVKLERRLKVSISPPWNREGKPY